MFERFLGGKEKPKMISSDDVSQGEGRYDQSVFRGESAPNAGPTILPDGTIAPEGLKTEGGYEFKGPQEQTDTRPVWEEAKEGEFPVLNTEGSESSENDSSAEDYEDELQKAA